MSELRQPTAIDSERALLASVVTLRDDLDVAAGFVRGSDFFDSRHRAIFDAAHTVGQSEGAYDLVTIATALRSSGALEGTTVLLAEIASEAIVSDIEHHAKQVRRKSRHRRALATLQRLVAIGYGADDTEAWIEQVEAAVFDIAAEDEQESSSATVAETISEVLQQIDESGKPDGERDYVPTSLSALNHAMSGWEVGYMSIIAARPGNGKTSMLIREMLVASGRVFGDEVVGGVLFTLEMPRSRVGVRALSQESMVPSNKMRHPGKLNDDEWREIAGAAANLSKRPLYIDDTPGLTVAAIRSKLRLYQAKLRRNFGDSVRLRIVGVDYLQLVQSDGVTREDEVARVSLGLRHIAREFGVALIAVASMSRESEKGGNRGGQRRPKLSDLRSSGQIEYDAATILFLYNPTSDLPPEEQSDEVTAIIAKCRQDATGDVRLVFQSDVQRFFSREEHQSMQYDQEIGGDFDAGF